MRHYYAALDYDRIGRLPFFVTTCIVVLFWGLVFRLLVLAAEMNLEYVDILYNIWRVGLSGVFAINTVLAIRRLHDVGASGWWAILLFIPLIGSFTWLVLCFIPGSKGGNQYGLGQTDEDESRARVDAKYSACVEANRPDEFR